MPVRFFFLPFGRFVQHSANPIHDSCGIKRLACNAYDAQRLVLVAQLVPGRG